MGLLDTITSGLKEQALQSTLENILGKNAPDLSKLLKNVDQKKIDELIAFFKKNGVPDTKEEITELINKLTK